ncbi:unnamed protein product, partial [marine sediment metagenome]
YSDEAIDKILISNPPVYSNGKYYKEMSKKFKVTQKYIKERCIELRLINIRSK